MFVPEMTSSTEFRHASRLSNSDRLPRCCKMSFSCRPIPRRLKRITKHHVRRNDKFCLARSSLWLALRCALLASCKDSLVSPFEALPLACFGPLPVNNNKQATKFKELACGLSAVLATTGR